MTPSKVITYFLRFLVRIIVNFVRSYNYKNPSDPCALITRRMHGILADGNDPTVDLCTVLCAAKIHAGGAVE